MRIVVLERESVGQDISLDRLNTLGEVFIHENAKQEDVPQLITDADIILVNKLIMNASSLQNAKNLKLICETATGYNNIDLEYCKSRKITVTNARNYSTPSVAQHTFALLLSVYENLSYYNHFVTSGGYSASNSFTHLFHKFHELEGKTYGIIGLGNIGRKVANIAAAFGCRVIYYSASGNTYDVPYERVDFDTLITEGDIISIHCPLTRQTNHLLTYDVFQKMKSSAIVVNTGRGPVICETDLARALDEGLIAGAGLDVFETEPISANNPLRNIKNKYRLIMTPHIGWGSIESRTRLMDNVIENIQAYLDDNPINVVI